MAISRKSLPLPEQPADDTLACAIEAGLDGINETARIAIALSGGLDSSVLLHATAQHHRKRHIPLPIALHIHHGLQKLADDWLVHCQQLCASLGIQLFHAHVQISSTGPSLEARARTARYAALLRLAEDYHISHVLTAHHANDQAETLLLNLLRGTGIPGLSGMANERPIDSRSKSRHLMLVRPLLDITRDTLETYARLHSIDYVEDPSNLDTRVRRNALRHTVFPALVRIQPSAIHQLARSATHASEARHLLDELAREDLTRVCQEQQRPSSVGTPSLNIGALLALSAPRQRNAVRYWLNQQHIQAPSSRVLDEILRQARASRTSSDLDTGQKNGHASRACIVIDTHAVRIWRDHLHAVALTHAPGSASPASEVIIRWDGETRLSVPNWSGSLSFHLDQQAGVPAAWLRGHDLRITRRQGGESLKLHPERPARTLKNLYQESDIPPWQRLRMPLVTCNDRLLYAAGLGMDTRYIRSGPEDAPFVRLMWTENLQGDN